MKSFVLLAIISLFCLCLALPAEKRSYGGYSGGSYGGGYGGNHYRPVYQSKPIYIPKPVVYEQPIYIDKPYPVYKPHPQVISSLFQVKTLFKPFYLDYSCARSGTVTIPCNHSETK